MPIEYKVLSEEQRQHFLEHGWIRIEKALNPEIMEKWLADFWVRLPGKPDDPSSWEFVDVAMPRHREVPNADLLGPAWPAICELVGGEDRIHPVRERYQGDQFIFNAGSKEFENWPAEKDIPPQQHTGWHTDNDWYRQFLDSSGNQLTIICCYSDILPRGGGTWLAEDGIRGIVEYLYKHPEGIEWPYKGESFYEHVKTECKQFTQVVANKGDVFLLHGHLPHCVGKNYIRAPRIITNPHCNGHIPYNFNREDPEDFSLVEKVILRALGKERLPDWKNTRERKEWYPRNYICKGSRIPLERERMIAAKVAEGGREEDVDSIHVRRDPQEVHAYMERSGLNKPYGADPWIEDTRPKGDYYAYQLEQLIVGEGTKHSPDGRARPT
ncbi:hypothetical protein CALVIDRAFT_525340 [Calocera viscosa TUFC12733]|uniref:Clavaminate synthase-like protein n=1 Tax=Calocera viscosa (strain TUFC12733) TaxID=1330018 RepID=A0A167QJI4_CALVF|nr:hypothetical protein CALVIDRAFT_525340 [Calocera viscosa TUFC12733]